jgi:large subunit ribosomal protein L25
MLQILTTPRAPKETKKEACIPAVYYGAHAKSTPIFINAIDFGKVFSSAGESSTVTLSTEHGPETVLIQDVQRDPVKGHPVHVDFYVIEKGQKVHVQIPLHITGESPAVKAGGVLVQVMHELSVEGEPSALPHDFTVDISSLVAMDSVIHVSDIALPKGVTLYHIEPTDTVVAIAAAKDEPEAPVTPIDLSAIEVEKKGKKEEEAAPEA